MIIINNHKIGIILIALVLGFASCSKIYDNQPNLDGVVTVNNNYDDLNRRMTIIHDPVMTTGDLKSGKGDNYGYTWYFVADVQAPVVKGSPLSATDVRVYDDIAYVSYNRQGDVYAGAVDMIDISDFGNPALISSVEFDGVDINTLAVDEDGNDAYREVWLAGSSIKKGAILRKLVNNENAFTSEVADIELSNALSNNNLSASANGVGLTKYFIYATSGNRFGGTYQIDRKTMEFKPTQEYSDAKAIAISDGYQVSLVAGDDARLYVYKDDKDHKLKNEFALGSIVHQYVDEPYLGKATVSFGHDKKVAFIAMNSGGMKAVDIEDGSTVYTSPSAMLTTGNTHGLAVDDDFVYMANSDDGLFIGSLPYKGGEVIPVQHWDLEETGASANMVQTDGDWIFVAKGGGGLKILRKVANSFYPSVNPYDENGKPKNNEGQDLLCDNLLNDFNLALPEGKDLTKVHPEYFTNTNREIVLTKNADVSVTFVSEGASYRNSFGYYIYNVNDIPDKEDDIKANMKIIFANASATGSGGTLNEGDRVHLGTFSAGTVIGYFVISDGWNGTKVTEGLSTLYTNKNFNKDKTQQALTMYSESCETLLSTFEDIHTKVKTCDKDYNDLVIKTTISPMTATNTTSFIQLSTAK